MKHLVALLAIAIVGCKSGDKPAPTPVPTETGSSAGSATAGSAMAGSGSGSGAGAGAATTGSGSGSNAVTCLITIAMTRTNISWSGGGISEGHSDYKPGEPPHLDVLKAVAPGCEAFLTADDNLKYQDVIAVMDSIMKLGLVNISLGKAGDTPTPKKTTRPQPNIDMKWVKGADGKLTLQGTLDPMSGNAVSKDTLVLVITKTQVTFKGEVLGKPDDAAIDVKIAAKLPPSPKDPTLIIQADASTSSATINRVITAASNQGYTNVLFAVKNK